MILYIAIFFAILFVSHIFLEKRYNKSTYSAENTNAEHQRLMQEYNKIIFLISFLISIVFTLIAYFYFK